MSGDDGTAIFVSTLRLAPGGHSLRLLRYGAGLGPDQQGSAFIDGVVLEPLQAAQRARQTSTYVCFISKAFAGRKVQR